MAKRTVRDLILRIKDQGVAGTTRQVDGLLGKTNKLGPAWAMAGKAGKAAMVGTAVAVTAATAATVAGMASIIGTGAEVETYKVQLNTVMRDTAKATQLLKDLKLFGKQTPFELPGLIEASIQLESFGFNSGFVMEAVGDGAAAMNKDIMQAAMAVTQGMLGEMEMLKQFTITSADITKKLGHDINRKTIEGQRETGEAILAVFRDKFGGGMEEMSKTWGGIMSNLRDAFWNLKADIAAGGVFETVKADLKVILDWVDAFTEAGGIDQLVTGFNRGFDQIHDIFFEPMFDNFGEMSVTIDTLGTKIELMMLQMAGVGLAIKPIIEFSKIQWELTGGLLKGGQGDIEGVKSLIKVLMRARRLGQEIGGEGMGLGYAEEKAEIDARMAVLKSILAGTFVGPMPPVGFGRGGGGPGDEGTFRTKPTKPGTFDPFDPDTLMDREGRAAEFHAEIVAGMLDTDTLYFQSKDELALSSSLFYVDTVEMGYTQAMRLQQELFKFQVAYAQKGAHLGRVTNALLIRGAGEVAKAGIEAITRKSKIEALSYTADAFALLAMGNIGGASVMFGAAAKKGAIAGAAAIATQMVENAVSSREEALLPGADFGADIGGVSTTSSQGFSRGAASVVKTGPQVINNYISLNYSIDGDYNTFEGANTPAEEIQDMLDQGFIQVAN